MTNLAGQQYKDDEEDEDKKQHDEYKYEEPDELHEQDKHKLSTSVAWDSSW